MPGSYDTDKLVEWCYRYVDMAKADLEANPALAEEVRVSDCNCSLRLQLRLVFKVAAMT